MLAGDTSVNTDFLGDEVEFALDVVKIMLENACGTKYGKALGSKQPHWLQPRMRGATYPAVLL
jgi:hypothetical protein